MALDKKLVDTARKQHGYEKVILSLEQKGFSVALLKDGTTSEKEIRDVKEAKDAKELLDFVESSSVAWVDYIVEDLKNDAPEVAVPLGFSTRLVDTLLKGASESGYEDLDTEMGLLVPLIYMKEHDIKISHLLILLRTNMVVTIHIAEATRFFRLRRYGKIFMRKIKVKLPKSDKITMILTRTLDENNSRNFDALRGLEKTADSVSEKLSQPDTPREEIGKEIHLMKHALMVYMNGLWQTVDVLNTLRYGDPELLTDDKRLLDRIGALVLETNYQIELAEHMSQVLASGLEVMQSIYNNQLQVLNNKLALLVAYLTVLGTAVLVPNTIATIFGVPFLPFGPEFTSNYSLIITGSTIISIILAFWWVKSKGLLPEKAD